MLPACYSRMDGTRLQAFGGWEPYRDGASPAQGLASDWVYWWEKVDRETHTVFAPTSSVLAFAFGHDDRPVPNVL
jgi:hypothetical protein